MAAKTSNSGNNSIVEINVIPLVDIILVVLIIFMVAAPLVMQPKIDINLPKSTSAKQERDKTPLRVVLGKQGELFLNNNPVTLAELQNQSLQMVQANPEVNALLVADKDSTLELVTEVVDAVKGGGVKTVAFSIQKKK